jgi:hypothetical protein
LTSSWSFTDEFIECQAEEKMKLRNKHLFTEVACDGVTQAVDEGHEREGALLELVCNKIEGLLDRELEHVGLNPKEEEELEEFNSDIQSMEEDNANLREHSFGCSGQRVLQTPHAAQRNPNRTWLWFLARKPSRGRQGIDQAWSASTSQIPCIDVAHAIIQSHDH